MRSKPRWSRGRPAVVTAIAAIALMALSSCGGLEQGGGDVAAGSLAESVSLEGASYTVGSKDFDEQLVLCNIAIVALRSVGAEVTERCDLGGTNAVRQALLGGEIDAYWGYTGTAWVSFFQQEPIPDSQALYEAVKTRDAEENNIVWLERSQFNNTYAFAVEKAQAAELGLKTLADMAAYVPEHPQPGLVCVESEYLNRDDGLSGLLEAYDFQIPEGSLLTLNPPGVIYQAVAGPQCLFGEVFTTDGRIAALNLEVLEDPKNYHIIYNAAIAMRKEAFEQNPAVAEVFAPIANALTQDEMTGLNALVSAEGQDPKAVATTWLREQGFIGAGEGG